MENKQLIEKLEKQISEEKLLIDDNDIFRLITNLFDNVSGGKIAGKWRNEYFRENSEDKLKVINALKKGIYNIIKIVKQRSKIKLNIVGRIVEIRYMPLRYVLIDDIRKGHFSMNISIFRSTNGNCGFNFSIRDEDDSEYFPSKDSFRVIIGKGEEFKNITQFINKINGFFNELSDKIKSEDFELSIFNGSGSLENTKFYHLIDFKSLKEDRKKLSQRDYGYSGYGSSHYTYLVKITCKLSQIGMKYLNNIKDNIKDNEFRNKIIASIIRTEPKYVDKVAEDIKINVSDNGKINLEYISQNSIDHY